MRKYLCISNYCRIFASEKETKNKLNPKTRKGREIMKAYIDITKKSHKNGETYINDQVQNMNDCYAWFDMNMDYLNKVAMRKSTESVKIYVKEQYNIIYEFTI